MSENEIKKKKIRINLSKLFIVYLVLCLISLLSVIPFNLSMRLYDFFYMLVPVSAAIMLLMLPLFVSFPFFDLSRKLIMQSDYKHRFIRSRLTSKIILLALFIASFIAALVFNSPTTYDMRIALNLSLVGIIVGFLPTIPMMIVFDSFELSSNYSIKRDFNFNIRFIKIVLISVVTITITQFILLLNWGVFAAAAITLLVLFIVLMVRFYKNEKEKLIPKKKSRDNPLYMIILQIVYIGVTIAYCTLLILYMFILTRGYLIINFDEYYAGFFLAIHGSYTLFHIIFYSILYVIMRRKGLFDYVEEVQFRDNIIPNQD